MVEIETVGELTEEELIRSAQLDRLEVIGGFVPNLRPGEFTRADATNRWGWKTGKAKRELELLIESGHLEKGRRYDPRVKRQVWGYWFVDGKRTAANINDA